MTKHPLLHQKAFCFAPTAIRLRRSAVNWPRKRKTERKQRGLEGVPKSKWRQIFTKGSVLFNFCFPSPRVRPVQAFAKLHAQGRQLRRTCQRHGDLFSKFASITSLALPRRPEEVERRLGLKERARESSFAISVTGAVRRRAEQ